MKNHSFYQFVLTQRGAKNGYGQFAEAMFEDLMFPKYENQYHMLSDYIENYGSAQMKLSLFDDLYREYEEWRKF
ncbi:YozE family protein [Macrococcus carouselicus]|uniref:YozE family protein n=1 Tax=Macrococcus carouselicus TaxID=69969 RepID=A0A9Q8CP64_9STAP|nr:YozE family protein [Macrococcus carouselicus]TDM04227.1 YozE family protein [Macrococcus carouselicus]